MLSVSGTVDFYRENPETGDEEHFLIDYVFTPGAPAVYYGDFPQPADPDEVELTPRDSALVLTAEERESVEEEVRGEAMAHDGPDPDDLRDQARDDAMMGYDRDYERDYY